MNFRLKQLFAIILALLIISISGTVLAADVTVGGLALSTDKTVEQGKEFTVNINLSNFQTSASTVTIIGKIEYDKTKLEYVSGSISSNTSEGWDDVESLGEQCFKESNMGFLFENRTPKKIGANSNFLTLKFKAKADVEGNADIKVVVSSVSDATNFNGSSVTVAVTKPVANPPATENPSGQGTDKQDKNETKVPTQTNETKKPSTQKDNTIKTGKLPQTGENDIIWNAFIVCVVACVISFFLYIRDKHNAEKQD